MFMHRVTTTQKHSSGFGGRNQWHSLATAGGLAGYGSLRGVEDRRAQDELSFPPEMLGSPDCRKISG